MSLPMVNTMELEVDESAELRFDRPPLHADKPSAKNIIQTQVIASVLFVGIRIIGFDAIFLQNNNII